MNRTPRTDRCYMVEELRETSEQLETELAEAWGRMVEYGARLTEIKEILEWQCRLCTDQTRCDQCVTKGLKDLAVTQSNTGGNTDEQDTEKR